MAKDYYNQYLSEKLRSVEDEESLRAEKNKASLEILKEQFSAIKEASGEPVSLVDIAEITGSKEDKAKAREIEIKKARDSSKLIDKAYGAYQAAAKTLNNLGSNAMTALDYYDVPRRVAGFQILDQLGRIKQDIDKGNIGTALLRTAGGDYAAEAATALSNKESVIDAFKKIGARKAEMYEFSKKTSADRDNYNADIDDLMSTVIGSETWGNIKSTADKYTELPESLRSVPIKPFIGLGIDKEYPVDVKKAIESAAPGLKAVKHWHFLTDIAYQTLTDPLTYIPFGAPTKLAGNAVSSLYKGTLSQAKRIPGMAPVIEKSAQAMGDLTEKVIGSFDLKYPASRSIKQVLGDEAGESLIENIEEIAREPKRMAEVTASKIKDIQKKASIVPIHQRILNKITGSDPMVNDMARSKNIQEWDAKVAQAMQNVELDAGVQHAKIFKDELADAVKTISSDVGFNEKQIEAVRRRVSVLRATKSASELDAAGNKVTIEYAKDLEKLMSESQEKLLGRSGKAFEIARDRRDAAIALTKGNYKVWKNARKEAVTKTKLEERNVRKAANDLIREMGKKATSENKKILFEAEKTFQDKIKLIRTARVDPAKKGSILKEAKNEFDSFVKNFEEASNKKLVDEYGKVISTYQQDMATKVNDFISGIPANESMVKDYKKSLKLIDDNYNNELKSLDKNIRGLKFADIYNKAMIKYKGIADSVFEKNIADLDDAGKELAREIRSVFDERATAEVAAGLYDLPIPEYYSRILKKQPFLEFDPEAPMSIARGSGVGAGFKKGRLEDMYSYQKFKEATAKKGGETLDSARETVLTREVMSRVELARQNVWEQLPEALKTGKNRNNMIQYLDYVFLGKNPWSKGASGGSLPKRIYDRFTFYNKSLLTVFSPTFYFRNIAGYPALAANQAGVKAFDPSNIAEFMSAKTGLSKTVSNGKQTLSSEEFFKEMFNRNVTISSFTRGNIVENARWMLNDFSKADPRYYLAKGLHTAQATEDFGRMYAAFTLFKQGKSLDDAARYAKKAMYTFDNFNVIDKTLGGLMTFYSFKRKNLIGTLTNMVRDPKQYSLMNRLITNMSNGEKPLDEDLNSLNEWDRDKLLIFGDFVKGGQLMQSLGFTPYEEAYGTVSPLLNGEWAKFFDKNIIQQMNMPVQVALESTRAIPALSDNKSLEYVPLPREFQAQPNVAKLVGKVSKMLTGQGLLERDVIKRVNGEPQYEKQYLLPEIMTKIVRSAPWARLKGDYLRLVQSYADKTGKHPAEVTVLNLIQDGHFKDPKGLAKFITGINEKIVDFEYLKRNKSNSEYFKMKRRMEADKLLTPYGMPKEVKAKYYESLTK